MLEDFFYGLLYVPRGLNNFDLVFVSCNYTITIMIEILEEIGDIIFGNKRLDTYRHFATSKDFRLRRKHNPETLPIDVLSMQLFKENRKKRAIKGFIFKRETQPEVLSQIFDLIVYTEFGKRNTTIYLYENEKMHLPYFHVKPKSGFSKLGNIFTSNDWSYVNRDFARQFEVETTDINEMQMMLTEQFADVLLHLQDHHVEGNGHHLIVYKRNQATDIIDMDNIYLDGLELIDIILHDHSQEMI